MLRLVAMALWLVPVLALAAPNPGQRFPGLVAKDVEGKPQRLEDLLGKGKGPTLIVAITDRGASDEMRAWFKEADKIDLPDDRRISIVSLNLSFLVTDDYARSKAREEIPQRFWYRSLMDKNGKMAEELGLSKGDVPWAWVVAPDGKVLASAHGKVDVPGASSIWKALKTPPSTR